MRAMNAEAESCGDVRGGDTAGCSSSALLAALQTDTNGIIGRLWQVTRFYLLIFLFISLPYRQAKRPASEEVRLSVLSGE